MRKLIYIINSLFLFLVMIGVSGLWTYSQASTTDSIAITTVEDLICIQDNLSASYQLMNDIDLEGMQWEPIGSADTPFTGSLDGNGYRIRNLSITSSLSYQGLFSSIQVGEVKNLTIENAAITGDSFLGAVAGIMKDSSTIDNCHMTGLIEIEGNSHYIGGLVGYCYNSSIKTTTVESALVKGENSVGGLAGYAGRSKIENAHVSADVKGAQDGHVLGGLIGCLYYSDVLHSNTLAEITGSEKLGGLIGYGNVVTLEDCYANQQISGTDEVGGLIGCLESGSIHNCYSKGTTQGQNKVGGLAGYLNQIGDIQECYTEGSVAGDTIIGGLAGYVERYTIMNSYSVTDISASKDYVGGFVGYMKEHGLTTALENCFTIGEVEAPETSQFTGGLIGYAQGGQKINSCYAGIQADQGILTGGLFGYSDNILCEGCYYDGTAAQCNPSGWYNTSRHTQEMRALSTYKEWDFEETWAIEEGESYPYLKGMKTPSQALQDLPLVMLEEGDGTQVSPYKIDTKDDLNQIRYHLNAHYQLQEDIDLDHTEWEPIGSMMQPFKGTLDGNSYTLSHLVIKDTHTYSGLMACISGGTIKDLVIDDASIQGETYLGILSGYANNHFVIENIKLSGTIDVQGNSYIGGLIGRGCAGSIENVQANVELQGSKSIGGIIGSSRECTIEQVSLKGIIHGENQVGGLAGFFTQSIIQDSYVQASINSSKRAGGLVGLFGYQGISNIDKCYSASPISGTDIKGGLVGENYDGTIEDSYYDNLLVPSALMPQHGRTTETLKQQDSFSNWDFDTLWELQENLSYPQLQQPDTPQSLTVIDVASQQLTLEWDPVDKATGYEIEIDRDTVIELGNVTTYTHTSLNPGTIYRYRVRAKKNERTGFYSPAIHKITLPAAPQNIRTTSKDKAVTIQWDEVLSAVRYEIEIYHTPINVNLDTQYTHTNLSPNTQYAYRVRAVNESGAGEWSEAVAETTLTDMVGHITIQAAKDNILVSWDALSGAKKYELMINEQETLEIMDTYYQHMDLIPNTIYSYQVRALGEKGYGPWSNLVTEKTWLPDVKDVTVESTDSEIRLSWNKVEGADSYELMVDGQSIIVVTEQYNHINIAPNTHHTYTIRALSEHNMGDWTETLEGLTGPDIPTSLEAEASITTIEVTWDRLLDIEGYDLEIDGQIQELDLETSYRHDHLLPYSTHTYRIRARNAAGTGQWSSEVIATTLLGIPTIIQTEAEDTAITLTWESVEGADGYIVFADGESIHVGQTNTYKHTGLEPNSLHIYRVKAVTSTVEGLWSDLIEASTNIAMPVNVYCSSASDSITVLWDSVAGAVGYDIEVDGTVFTIKNNAYYHSDLEPYTAHQYRIRAYNAVSRSEWTHVFLYFTGPEAPKVTELENDTEAITLHWEKVDGAISYDILADDILYSDIEKLEFTHSDLEPNTRHTYQVRAKSSTSISLWSEPVEKNTKVELSADVGKDNFFNFITVVPPKAGSEERIITVHYHPNELEVIDLCALTSKLDTSLGSIEGTSIEVTKFSKGTIQFKVNHAVKTVMNSIQFLVLENGHSKVHYTVE